MQYLRKEEWGQIGERNKTIILLRVSTIAKPRPEGRGGAVSAAVQTGHTLGLFYFGPAERNKMTEVLLRSPGWNVCSRPEGLLHPGIKYKGCLGEHGAS